MSSVLGKVSLGRLATAPGARQIVRRWRDEQDKLRLAVGTLESHLLELREVRPGHLEDAEFQVFSQFGEDGILQHLVQSIRPSQTTFVEIGAGDYRESNTRFLLQHDNWKGLVIDAGQAHVDFIHGSHLGWRHDVQAVASFVTRDNVNDLPRDHGFAGEIGVLSIDVDGVDYWIWEAIEVVQPAIVVVEYNALLGPDRTVTVPYAPEFSAADAHFSQQYFGASLAALDHLARRRGYRFVGCASNAANAFFVRDGLAEDVVPTVSVQDGYRPSRFRTARNPDGSLARRRDAEDRLAGIAHLPFVDVVSGAQVTLDAPSTGLGDRTDPRPLHRLGR